MNTNQIFYSISHLKKLLALTFTSLILLFGHDLFAQEPSFVAIPGNFQNEIGCTGDWQPDCSNSYLIFNPGDGVWQATFTIPAGNWEYKAALNNSWIENYGLNATPNGPNIPLNLGSNTDVKFYYDHETHWITDNVNSTIAVAVGNFQSELGCSGDWQPNCLRSWLKDPDGDGICSFMTDQIPEGSYEVKVALNESWDINYGAGGQLNGANIQFDVPYTNATMLFTFDLSTHILIVSLNSPPSMYVNIPGNFQSELGCAGDWVPGCGITNLAQDPGDDVWKGIFTIPAGNWEYKAALNNSWIENYGLNATPNGPNIPLSLGSNTDVKFYYDQETHWITDNVNSTIAVAVGNFQSELGCSGDWQPNCMRSWLQDPDGDGIYIFATDQIPEGSYEAKVAHNESWAENYGDGGVLNGTNISFLVPHNGSQIIFSYDAFTHILTIYNDFDPPIITLADPSTLWPPDHKYANFNLQEMVVSVQDEVDGDIPIEFVDIDSVSIDEPDNSPGEGDGNTIQDIKIASDCKSVDLRKERQGEANGRVYTINLSVSDAAGNVGYASYIVDIPHDQYGIAIDDGIDHSIYCGSENKSSTSAEPTDYLGVLELISYPNPFCESTKICFSIPESDDVQVKIFNSLGVVVANIFEGYAKLNTQYNFTFKSGVLPEGLYYCKILTGKGQNQVKKMMLMK